MSLRALMVVPLPSHEGRGVPRCYSLAVRVVVTNHGLRRIGYETEGLRQVGIRATRFERLTEREYVLFEVRFVWPTVLLDVPRQAVGNLDLGPLTANVLVRVDVQRVLRKRDRTHVMLS